MAKEKANVEMRNFLQQFGLSQRDIAAAAGITPSAVCLWFRIPFTETKRAEVYALALKAYEQKYKTKMKTLIS